MAYTSEVHFDCMYRGITAVSSRESKLLAGNCSIAQVLTFDCLCVCVVSEREGTRHWQTLVLNDDDDDDDNDNVLELKERVAAYNVDSSPDQSAGKCYIIIFH